MICLIKYEDYEEIFFLPPDIGVAVLVCGPIQCRRRHVTFLWVRWTLRLVKRVSQAEFRLRATAELKYIFVRLWHSSSTTLTPI